MEIVGKDIIGRAQAEAGHNVVVGCPLVAGKMCAAIGKVIETQRAVESQFIDAMLSLHLSVVSGRCDPDALVENIHILQRLLKETIPRIV